MTEQTNAPQQLTGAEKDAFLLGRIKHLEGKVNTLREKLARSDDEGSDALAGLKNMQDVNNQLIQNQRALEKENTELKEKLAAAEDARKAAESLRNQLPGKEAPPADEGDTGAEKPKADAKPKGAIKH